MKIGIIFNIINKYKKGGERVWGGVKGAADEIISSGDQMNPGKLFDFDESFSPSNSYSSSFISSNSFNVSDEDHSVRSFFFYLFYFILLIILIIYLFNFNFSIFLFLLIYCYYFIFPLKLF